MIRRLLRWLESLLVTLDQLAHMLGAGPKYILVGGPRPNPDETVSGKVGRMAAKGHKWAVACEWAIDGLFRLIGAGKGHCRKVAAREAGRGALS